ncbi:MAG: hypothetical protein RL153_338, partial [Verrucomicrobiota bacterium]
LATGRLMRANLSRPKKVNEVALHDIKLDLDVRCQRLITRSLAKACPSIPVLGEEGIDPVAESAPFRWVVDPIDGTVNFARGIPHACVSIALQQATPSGHTTVAGVVHDPFMNETWTATATGPARRNGRVIHVSQRGRLADAVVSVGFAKNSQSLEQLLPLFAALTPKVCKLRLMGSAALALAYVADGRFDAYVEGGIRLWDVAAGGLVIQRAGGLFEIQPIGPGHRYSLVCNNGLLDRPLRRVIRSASTKRLPP